MSRVTYASDHSRVPAAPRVFVNWVISIIVEHNKKREGILPIYEGTNQPI